MGKELIKNFPLFDRGTIAAEGKLVCVPLQFLITGFNCCQVGKSLLHVMSNCLSFALC